MRLSDLNKPTLDESLRFDDLVVNSPQRERSTDVPKTDDPTEKHPLVKTETMDDGTTVWVVRKETKQERMQKFGERFVKAVGMIDQDDPLFDKISIKPHGLPCDPAIILKRKKGQLDPDVLRVFGVKKAFADYEPGIEGLVPKNSEEAENYRRCIGFVRSGKVRLPTVAEYEAQLKEVEERKRQEMENTNQNGVHTPPAVTPTVTPQNNATSNVQQPAASTPPVVPAPSAPYADTALPPNRAQAEVAEKTAQKVKPLNLVNVAKRNTQPVQSQQTPPVAPTPPEPEPPTVTFQVGEGQANSFYAAMPDTEKQKVSAAQIIKINEVRTLDVPTSVRTVDSITDYRKIIPKKVTGEFKEVVLPNSGYIATVCSASSLEMASIIPDMRTGDIDYHKRYQFCFDHLVTTTIGTMTYIDFITKTSPTDLIALVGAIYQASQPEKQDIALVCGNAKCGKEYNIKFNTSELIDVDGFDDETKIQINNIIAAREVLGEALEMQKESPVMVTHSYKLSDDEIVTIKHTDGQMMIERQPTLPTLAKQYNDLVPFLILFVKEIRMHIVPEGFTEPEWFTITSPDIIAEELFHMPDEQLTVLLEGINGLSEFGAYRYAFQGEFTCPHCGRIDKKVAVEIDDLVFRKVSNIVNRN